MTSTHAASYRRGAGPGLLVVAVVLLGACAGDPLFSLEVGDCLMDPGAGVIKAVDIVDCADDHEFEVYATHMLSSADAWDQARVEAQGDKICLQLFESFVGRPFDGSGWDFTWLGPSEQSWRSGDREVVCMLGPTSGTTTGSARGSST